MQPLLNVINGEESGFTGSIQINFTGITTNPTGSKLINLGTRFQGGLSDSEINKGSGQIIYMDNRPKLLEVPDKKRTLKSY